MGRIKDLNSATIGENDNIVFDGFNGTRRMTYSDLKQKLKDDGFSAESSGVVRYDKTQSLDASQKKTARENISAVSEADVENKINAFAVKYASAQALTASQKRTARTNIGAIDATQADSIAETNITNHAVRYDTAQEITSDEKQQARENIDVPSTAEVTTEIGTALNDSAVRYDIVQSLTDMQKATARSNIGAADDYKLTDLKSALNYSLYQLERGYIDAATGNKVDSEHIVRTKNKIPLAVYKTLEYSDPGIVKQAGTHFTGAYVAYFNGTTHINNQNISDRFAPGVTGADSVYLCFVFDNDFSVSASFDEDVTVSVHQTANESVASIYAGKKISIIGDSIDTFNQYGFRYESYYMYYPAEDITKVNQTWWKQVIDTSGAVLEVNASFSGSLVTKDTSSTNAPDFYERVSIIGSPDVIFVALGVNDSIALVELGDYDFTTAYQSLSESTFRTAYIKGMKALIATYPNARIVCIAERMKTQYKESISYIANKLGATFIDASDYTTSGSKNPHPNCYGMKQIAEHVLSPVDSMLKQNLVSADAKVTGASLEIMRTVTNDFSVSKQFIKPDLINGYIDGSNGNFIAGSYFVSTANRITTNGNELIRILPGEKLPQNIIVSLYNANNQFVINMDAVADGNEFVLNLPSNVKSIIINANYGANTDPIPYLFTVIVEPVTVKGICIEPTFSSGYIESGTGNYISGSYFASTTNKIETEGNQIIKVRLRYKQAQAVFISAYDSEETYMFNEDMVSVDGEYILYISNNVKYIIINVYYGSSTRLSPYMFSARIESLNDENGIDFCVTPRAILPFMPEIPEDASNYFRAVELNTGGIRVDSPTVFWDSLQNKWGMVYTEYQGDNSDPHTWHGRICAAHSYDLRNWINDGVILDRDYETEGAFDRYGLTGSYIVIKDNKYYLFYCGSPIGGWYESGELKIGIAIGTDLMNLERYSGNPVMAPDVTKWYRYKLYKTQIVKHGDTYYNFFNAAYTPDGTDSWVERMGFATSKDLLHWEINDQPLFEKEYYDLVVKQGYKHFITGDPCIYDIGDQYYYMDLFSAFNPTITWTSGGTTVSYAKTLKKNFPYGWEIFKWSMSKTPYTKSCVAYRGTKQYKFFTDYYYAVMGCVYE